MAGFEPGFAVPEAHATSTAPRHQGTTKLILCTPLDHLFTILAPKSDQQPQLHGLHRALLLDQVALLGFEPGSSVPFSLNPGNSKLCFEVKMHFLSNFIFQTFSSFAFRLLSQECLPKSTISEMQKNKTECKCASESFESFEDQN
jgi:hypothetical protein